MLGLAGAVVVAVALAARRPRAGPCSGPGPRRIAVVGDSITANGYGEILAAMLPDGTIYRPFAKIGASVREIETHLLPSALEWKPTDVVVLGGVNDVASGRAPKVAPVLRRIYEKVRASGARPVGVTILPWGSYRTSTPERERETQKVNREIWSTPGVCIVDTTTMGVDGKLRPGYTTDGLHLNLKGSGALSYRVASQAFMR